MELIIEKDESEVFYTFWAYGKYKLEVDEQFYTHHITDEGGSKVNYPATDLRSDHGASAT